MQTTSATYDRILAGTDISYETQLVIDDVGTYGESDLMSISTSIEMFQEDPDIGKAIASEINVVMLNPVLPIPTMARIRPQVKAKGIAPKSSKVTIVDEDLASEYASYSSENITFSTASGATVVGESLTFAVDSTEYLESEWLAQGVFYIDTREITANNNGLDILTIHGFDAMLKTEQIYSSNATVGDAPDISYVRAIADAIGVEVDPRTWEIMGTGYTIPFPVGYSMREILGYIASAYAGCFIISDTGRLRLVALEDIEDETRYLIDEIGEIIVFGVDSPQHTVTASGAVATFTAGGEYDLDELEIAIEPVQDLHGYANPWPAGGGVNKCGFGNVDFTLNGVRYYSVNGTLYVNGTSSGETSSLDAAFQALSFTLQAGTYYFSRNTFTTPTYLRSVDAQTTYATNAGSFTLAEETTLYIGFYVYNRTFSDEAVPLSVTVGSTAPSAWTPYANECPISGHTGVTVEQRGQNLADASTTVRTTVYRATTRPIEGNNGLYLSGAMGSVDIQGLGVSSWANSVTKFSFQAIEDVNVSLSGKIINYTENCNGYVYLGYIKNGSFTRLGTAVIFNALGTTNIQIDNKTIPKGAYLAIQTTPASKAENVTLNQYAEFRDIQVELGSTALPYEAYHGNTYQITWQDEAGTVYKGTLNVKTGVLTALWKYKEYTGLSSESWNYSTWSATNTYAFYSTASLNDAYYPSINYNCIVLCNQVPCSDYNSLRNTDVPAIAISGGSASSIWTSIRVPKTAISAGTASAFCTYLASNPLQILYELATPLTFQLTPTQVQTLVDQNNLWANTGNIINLEFTEPASEAVRILV